MSNSHIPAGPPPHSPRPPPSSGMHGCGIALLILVGVVLLLPGVCSLFFISAGMSSPLAALGLLVSLGGVALIVFAVSLTRKR